MLNKVLVSKFQKYLVLIKLHHRRYQRFHLEECQEEEKDGNTHISLFATQSFGIQEIWEFKFPYTFN